MGPHRRRPCASRQPIVPHFHKSSPVWGSHGKGWGPVFIRGDIQGVRHFLVNFCLEWLLWYVHVHFECAGQHKTRHLVQKSCQDTSYGDLALRPCIEICCRDLAKRSLASILGKELLWRDCTEISSRDLAKKSIIEYYRDLAQEVLPRDL